MEIFWEIHKNIPREGPGSDFYTTIAFNLIRKLNNKNSYNILDIGCGPGKQTIRLAELSDSNITAIDTHQLFPYLMFSAKILTIISGFLVEKTNLPYSASIKSNITLGDLVEPNIMVLLPSIVLIRMPWPR